MVHGIRFRRRIDLRHGGHLVEAGPEPEVLREQRLQRVLDDRLGRRSFHRRRRRLDALNGFDDRQRRRRCGRRRSGEEFGEVIGGGGPGSAPGRTILADNAREFGERIVAGRVLAGRRRLLQFPLEVIEVEGLSGVVALLHRTSTPALGRRLRPDLTISAFPEGR